MRNDLNFSKISPRSLSGRGQIKPLIHNCGCAICNVYCAYQVLYLQCVFAMCIVHIKSCILKARFFWHLEV